jgi:hypothetical protein
MNQGIFTKPLGNTTIGQYQQSGNLGTQGTVNFKG